MSCERHLEKLSPLVNGPRMPKFFDRSSFRSAFEYKAQVDDIFVVTYSRSGSCRVSALVYSLLTNGQLFDKDVNDYFFRGLFLDQFGKQPVEKLVHPCEIGTHLPFSRNDIHLVCGCSVSLIKLKL